MTTDRAGYTAGMQRRTYLAGLESALHGAGLPYGYTVVIWSSGQILIDLLGSPAIWLVLLFAAGAAAAYGALKWGSRHAEAAETQLAASPHLVRAGLIQVGAIAAAIGLVTLAGLAPPAVAWPLGGFLATVLYLAGTSVEMALRERDRGDAGGNGPASDRSR